jgi:cytochrome oxidase Cu insertion factor (SCO1/SenC/PrrC family)
MITKLTRYLITGVCAALFGSTAVAADAGTLTVGQSAPDFTVKNQDDKDVSPKDFKGKWAVIFFYPRDDTPG